MDTSWVSTCCFASAPCVVSAVWLVMGFYLACETGRSRFFWAGFLFSSLTSVALLNALAVGASVFRVELGLCGNVIASFVLGAILSMAYGVLLLIVFGEVNNSLPPAEQVGWLRDLGE